MWRNLGGRRESLAEGISEVRVVWYSGWARQGLFASCFHSPFPLTKQLQDPIYYWAIYVRVIVLLCECKHLRNSWIIGI